MYLMLLWTIARSLVLKYVHSVQARAFIALRHRETPVHVVLAVEMESKPTMSSILTRPSSLVAKPAAAMAISAIDPIVHTK
jgi:hypothetical protein